MRKDVTKCDPRQSLFRESATRAAGYRMLGEVTVVVPPSAGFAVVFGFTIILILFIVVSLVEVPQRSRAIGVLMPAGGLVDVVATESGRVQQVVVNSGDVVGGGDLLLTVATGDASARGRRLPEQNLHSLERELVLREGAYRQNLSVTSDRMRSLDQERTATIERQKFGEARLRLHEEQVEVLERRVTRWQVLAKEGHVTLDAFDNEYVALMSALASVAEASQRAVALDQDVRTLVQSMEALKGQVSVNDLMHKMEMERTRRDIARAAYAVSGDYRASGRAHVAHILVQPGMAVSRGQVLAKLRHPGKQMEAWLYVSTSQARLMQPGQSVEIGLDAYPKQVFGTFTATVSAISGVALLPREITVPLTISGPVFEIRAELHDDNIEADGMVWPLQPGISFRADVIQQRLKLYEWILRSLGKESNTGPNDTRA